MEMPTPCPQCSRICELNDMNTCGECSNSFCVDCLEEPWQTCDGCYLMMPSEDEQ